MLQIAKHAARVDVVSTQPQRDAKQSRYGNDVRAVNDDFLDYAGLGGANNALASLRISRAAGHAFVREHGGTGRVLLLTNATDVARHRRRGGGAAAAGSGGRRTFPRPHGRV